MAASAVCRINNRCNAPGERKIGSNVSRRGCCDSRLIEIIALLLASLVAPDRYVIFALADIRGVGRARYCADLVSLALKNARTFERDRKRTSQRIGQKNTDVSRAKISRGRRR